MLNQSATVMKRYYSLLLRVWREACRHIDIAESTATIFPLLAQELPLKQIIIRRLDLERSRLETVANHVTHKQTAKVPAFADLTPEELSLLIEWGARKKNVRGNDASAAALFRIAAARLANSSSLMGPLWGADRLEGIVVFRLSRNQAVDSLYDRLAEALLDPFAAALEIDRRLHEIETLREKAEADKRTLLTKLGRRDLATPIVGADAGLKQVMDRVETIGRSDVAVLLLGETGSGKEVVARAIHDRSARREGPFIRVNCGAIPTELIDSQLFGHERGSFTGAIETHQGWFERAEHGTLFLDEIGELPLAAQVRLLCVLQDGFIERVGGKHLIHVDVRIVAATHRDIPKMVQDNLFRQDLWYRIAVFPITIPPLRERPEDIPPLACHFAEKAATRFGLSLVMPTPDDLRLLATYSWPGNVRELAAVIDRAALLGNGRRLEIAKSLGGNLALDIVSTETGELAPNGVPVPNLESSPSVSSLSLDEAMRQHIERTLRACHGRVEGPFGAAKRLQMNPHTLRSKMRKLGIEWKLFRNND